MDGNLLGKDDDTADHEKVVHTMARSRSESLLIVWLNASTSSRQRNAFTWLVFERPANHRLLWIKMTGTGVVTR